MRQWFTWLWQRRVPTCVCGHAKREHEEIGGIPRSCAHARCYCWQYLEVA
jgi:hypothetical protein